MRLKEYVSMLIAAVLLLALFACGKPYTPVPNAPLVLGEKHLTDLDYEQALLQFDEAIVIDPKNPRGYLGKIITQERQGDLAGAKATLVSAKKQVKNFPTLDLDAEPETFYPVIVTWARENKLESFAAWLIGLLAKWFPGADWVEKIGAAPVTQSSTTQAEITEAVPENVFSAKDLEVLGITMDMDLYDVAATLGISRTQVDKEFREWESDGLIGICSTDWEDVTGKKTSAELGLIIPRRSLYEYQIGYYLPVSASVTLPHGIHFGMSPDEVLALFPKGYSKGVTFEVYDDSSDLFYIYNDQQCQYRGLYSSSEIDLSRSIGLTEMHEKYSISMTVDFLQDKMIDLTIYREQHETAN